VQSSFAGALYISRSRCYCLWLLLVITMNATGAFSKRDPVCRNRSNYVTLAGAQFPGRPSNDTMIIGHGRETAASSNLPLPPGSSFFSSPAAAAAYGFSPADLAPPLLSRGFRDASGDSGGGQNLAVPVSVLPRAAAVVVGVAGPVPPLTADAHQRGPESKLSIALRKALAIDDEDGGGVSSGVQLPSKPPDRAAASMAAAPPPRLAPPSPEASSALRAASMGELTQVDGGQTEQASSSQCEGDGGGCRLGCVCGTFDHCYSRWRSAQKNATEKEDVGVCELSPFMVFVMATSSILTMLAAFVLARFYLEDVYHDEQEPPKPSKRLASSKGDMKRKSGGTQIDKHE